MFGYDIWISHFPKEKGEVPKTNSLMRFETCLRAVDLHLVNPPAHLEEEENSSDFNSEFFLAGSISDTKAFKFKGELMSNEEAYQFLLELICGLKSKVLGETEILGQFKDFCQREEGSSHWPYFQVWMKNLLQDAKNIREEYLRGLGQQSYGGYLRSRLAPHSDLLILGAGSLVSDLLPWLSGHRVTVAARQLHKALHRVSAAKIKPQTLIDVVSTKAPLRAGKFVVIVAAPLSDSELLDLIPKETLAVFDFRAEGSPVKPEIPYHRLSDIFNSLTEQNHLARERAEKARQAIEELAKARFYKSSFHRPFGWEDACP